MIRFANTKLARMSDGTRCLIRDLGLVKGGKGLRHHEVVLELTWRGCLRFAAGSIRAAWSTGRGRTTIAKIAKRLKAA